MKKTQLLDDEHSAGIFGMSANLIITLVGVGIVEILYAMIKSASVAGTIITVLYTAACDMSLRLLNKMGKHMDVTSYKTPFEAAFGVKGFQTICCIMSAIRCGATISYLMNIKDMLSLLLGIDERDESMRQAGDTASKLSKGKG